MIVEFVKKYGALSFVIAFATVTAYIFLLTGSSGDLEVDAGFQWHSILAANATWDDYRHHQILMPLYSALYQLFHLATARDVAVKIVQAFFYVFFALSLYLISGSFTRQWYLKIALVLTAILNQAILSHLHILEDNLPGFPLVVLSLYFSVRFFQGTNYAGKSKRYAALIAGILGGIAIMLGLTYMVFIAATALGCLCLFKWKSEQRLKSIQSILNFGIPYSIGFIASIVILLLFKSIFSSSGFLKLTTSLLSNPYSSYSDWLQPFEFTRGGFRYAGATILATLASTEFLLVLHAVGVWVVLASAIALGYFWWKNRRASRTKRFLAWFALGSFLFQGFYLWTARDPSYLERTDFLALALPFLFVTFQARVRLIAFVTLFVLECCSGIMMIRYENQRQSNLELMKAFVHANHKVAFNGAFFLRNKQSGDRSENWTSHGLVAIYPPDECYVYGPVPIAPVQCKYVKNQTDVPAGFTLHEDTGRLTCSDFADSSLACAGQLTKMSETQKKMAREMMEKKCQEKSEILACYRIHKDDCSDALNCLFDTGKIPSGQKNF